MPSLTLKLDRLEKLVGKDLNIDDLEYDLQWVGLDVDDVNKEENEIKIEYDPNRPDYSSPEGIARSLKGYYELEIGLPEFQINEGTEEIRVNPKVRDIRPFVVGAIVRNIDLDEDQVGTLMNIQEALHWALGRDRKKVAIGIHDYDQVKGPYIYTTVKPEGVKFRPLHMEAYEMTPKEILEEHEMGIRYAHLLKDAEEYPIIYDAEGKVVSLPPIINGTYTTVTDKTKNLLLDLTGTDFNAVNYSLNIIATTFADMGAKLESLAVIYDDKPNEILKVPDFSPQIMEVHIDYINSYLGLKLSAIDIIKCLKKVRLDASKTKDKNKLNVKIPPYRVDFMHEVDIVEDVAIGYGYHNLIPVVKEGGFGKYHPAEVFANKTRDIMIGAGFLEMVNSTLSSQKDYENLGLDFNENEQIILLNPVSEKFNTTRSNLIVGLMKNLAFNRSAEKPFHLFEVGDILQLDKNRDVGASRELHLGAITLSEGADYSQIKSLLDHYFRTLGILDDIVVKPCSNPTFIKGRTGEIYYKKKKIGFVGEIYPQVILNFGLNYPVAAFEINLMPFFKDHEE
nr:phenylalanine--tRNA ligase subunit beta [Candidatus Prometheoarchaeum syntrophicum]QEE17846.1 Phenylalanine--tRNA ligase beta subunit [Candidatus Prometheoarchaeum syntrophicum]